MILRVCSVFDSAAGAYLQPFFAPTFGLAIRSFQDAVNDPNHQFNKHALDYTLFVLAEFNDADGTFTANPEGPLKLGTAFEHLTKDVTPPR